MTPAISLLVPLVLHACTVARPIASNPSPESIQAYLQTHPRAPLRVTDSAGRARWVYETALSGDTLRGLRATTMPRQHVAVPVRQITQVSAPRFSILHTLGLVGGILTITAILAFATPGPVY
jgi:hypothetical protein